jgi:hypothetical protein
MDDINNRVTQMKQEMDACKKKCKQKDIEIRKLRTALRMSRAAFMSCRMKSRQTKPPVKSAPPPPKTPRGSVTWERNSMGRWVPHIPSTPMTPPPKPLKIKRPTQMPYHPTTCSHNKKKHSRYKNVRY